VDARIAELPVPEPRHRVIFIQALMRLGGRLDVPFDERRADGCGDLVREHGLAGSGFALDEQWPAESDGRIHATLRSSVAT
jgi:hypothetical protein